MNVNKNWEEYKENYRTCYPCHYCENPKHIRQGLCTEGHCYGYSRFVPKPDTPQFVLDKVEDTFDSLAW